MSAVKHGIFIGNRKTQPREYRIWSHMKRRCLDKDNPVYYRYGGRGISVRKEWLDFVNFYKDMGRCPEGLTLERINVDGDYCKENCKWASYLEQSNNRRNTFKITFNGHTKSSRDWERLFSLKRNILYHRIKIKKMPFELAVISKEIQSGFKGKNLAVEVDSNRFEKLISLIQEKGAVK